MEPGNYNNPYEYAKTYATKDHLQEAVRSFFLKVYGWMTLGLVLTGVVAYVVASTPQLAGIFMGSPMFYVLLIGEVGLVLLLSARIGKMSASMATIMFLLYAFVNGLTFSVIFVVYEMQSIIQVFFISGGTFGIMSLYGMITKRDLTSVGSLAIKGLIGIIIASVVNLIFLKSSTFDLVISMVGVLIFVGLTAYDTWQLKKVAEANPGAPEDVIHKSAIIGALRLYLDFINLMLHLLRLMGNRR